MDSAIASGRRSHVLNPSGRDVERFLESVAQGASLEIERAEADLHLNEVIQKPWGHEYRVYADTYYDIWKLFIGPGQATSVHCHPRKETMLLCLAGQGRVHLLNRVQPLRPFDAIHLRKGIFHGTENVGTEPLELIEVETPRNKLDLVRIRDKYGRQGKGYEHTTASHAVPPLASAPYGVGASLRASDGRFRYALRAGLDLICRRDPALLFAVNLGLGSIFDQEIHVLPRFRLDSTALTHDDLYLTISDNQPPEETQCAPL